MDEKHNFGAAAPATAPMATCLASSKTSKV